MIELIKAPEYIYCPVCSGRSQRVGAQDYCDVYVCKENSSHLVRIKIGAARKEWNELASGNNEPTQ